jgi:UDP-N-acetylglucosamine diphosphorylase/glucosamine-1-phosphate N-acetyltransferase
MNYIFFDDQRINLQPLTFTRPVAELRTGIFTIAEKWTKRLSPAPFSYSTAAYLQKKYPMIVSDDNLFINGSVLPNEQLIKSVELLVKGKTLKKEGKVIAFRTDKQGASEFAGGDMPFTEEIEFSGNIVSITYPWDLFSVNALAITSDFELITRGRKSAPISSTNRVKNPENIFIEDDAVVEFAILNASEGPIYVGHHAEIMEGAIIRGGLALCDGSTLKMGAKIYGATTIGPHSKVGGEVHNTVITGYSNKGHDGFLGNSVLGEWCNLGADTNNSNLKNNYAEVKMWNYEKNKFIQTGLQFCGLIMGDHSKCGINTMFNTGTVVGVSANIFGDGFPRNFIPSFSWGGAQGFSVYTLNKVFDTASKVLARRGLELTETDKDILKTIFEITEKYRNF